MSVQDHPEAELTGQSDPPGTPAAQAGQAPADPHYARRWLVLVVVLVAQVMILPDGTVVNVALPSAQRDLAFNDASRQWVITSYVLAFGSLLPFGGRLADVVGRKTMFMTGLAGFAAASAAGGAAPTSRRCSPRGPCRARSPPLPCPAGRDLHQPEGTRRSRSSAPWPEGRARSACF